MPRGPKGEKRPANPFEAGVMIGRIATGEVDDPKAPKNPHATALGRLGGAKGGQARAASLTAAERRKIAQKAAKARWEK
jgi:hypothetical protein